MPKFRSRETMRAVKYEPGMETGFQAICDSMGQCVTIMRNGGALINCDDCNKEFLKVVPYVLNCDMPPHRMCIPEGGYLVILEGCTDDSKCYTEVLTKEELEENWEEVEEPQDTKDSNIITCDTCEYGGIDKDGYPCCYCDGHWST